MALPGPWPARAQDDSAQRRWGSSLAFPWGRSPIDLCGFLTDNPQTSPYGVTGRHGHGCSGCKTGPRRAATRFLRKPKAHALSRPKNPPLSPPSAQSGAASARRHAEDARSRVEHKVPAWKLSDTPRQRSERRVTAKTNDRPTAPHHAGAPQRRSAERTGRGDHGDPGARRRRREAQTQARPVWSGGRGEVVTP